MKRCAASLVPLTMHFLTALKLFVLGCQMCLAASQAEPGQPGRIVTRYALVSSYDLPSCDPSAWRLLASNDEGKSWDLLDTRTNQMFASRSQLRSYSISNRTAYSTYRLQIDRGNEASGGFDSWDSNIQLGDFELAGTTVGVSDEAELEFIATASDAHPILGPPQNAFDHDPKTRWYDFGLRHSTNCWIQCHYVKQAELSVTNLNQLQTLTRVVGLKDVFQKRGRQLFESLRQHPSTQINTLSGYALTSANDMPGRDPRDWRLVGSRDNGKTWEVVDQRHNEVFNRRFQRRVFTLPHSVAFPYYRLEIEGVRGEGTMVQLAELEPILSRSDTVHPVSTIISAKTDNPPLEALEMAFDGNPQTKWLSFEITSKEHPNWLSWQWVTGDPELPMVNRRDLDNLEELLLFSNLTSRASRVLRPLKGYAMTSANDHPERDPVEWRLRGSSDGGKTWSTLDYRKNQAFGGRGLRRTFSLEKEYTCSDYRLEVLSVLDPTSANSVQLAELEPIFGAERERGPLSVIVAARGDNGLEEGSDKLFDGEIDSKWLDFSDNSPTRASWVEWRYEPKVERPIVNLDRLNHAPTQSRSPTRVNLEGVVLYTNAAAKQLGLVDETASQTVEVGEVDFRSLVYKRVRLSGTLQVVPGLPRILDAKVTELAPLEEVAQVRMENSFATNSAFFLGKIEGKVTSVSMGRSFSTIEVESNDGTQHTLARIIDPAGLSYPVPLDWNIEIRGVVQPAFNGDGKRRTALIWVGRAEDLLLKPTGKAWELCRRWPLQPLNGTNLPRWGIVRVSGEVTQTSPGERLVLREGTNTLVVYSKQLPAPSVGSEVEAVGSFTRHENLPVLSAIQIRPKVADPSPTVANPGTLTTIRAIREMIESQPNKKYPVKLRGIVTYVEFGPGLFYLHDGSESIAIDGQFGAGLSPDLQDEGTYVEFTGMLEHNRVYATQFVKRIGQSTLPIPRRHSWDYLITGKDDDQWVEVEGVVKEADKQRFVLSVSGGSLVCRFKDLGKGTPEAFLGSLIRISGVCSPVLNNRNQRLGINLLVPSSECIRVLSPAPQDPFALRTSSIGDVLQLEPQTGVPLNRMVKISGILTFLGPQTLFVQQNTDGIRVLPRQIPNLKPGDKIEAVGLAELDGLSPKLTQARVKKIGEGVLPKPEPVECFGTGDEDREDQLDSTRVVTEGVLVGSSSRDGLRVLELEQDKTKRNFYAFIPEEDQSLAKIIPGSRLRLQGVFKCRTDALPDGGRVVTSFEMYLNSKSDITVLERPAWWTARRTLRVLGGAAAVLLLSLGWVRSLHRQVRQRTSQLNEIIREQKDTAEALATSETFMRSLIESLPQHIARKDPEGRFTFVNDLFCHTLGKSKDQILGRTDFDLFPKEMAEKFRRDDLQVMRTGQMLETEEENQNAAGDKITVQVIKTPIYANNRPIGLQLLFWDVTEKKRAQTQLEAAQKQLVETSRQAGMAEVATSVLHNVGNVLNSVNVSATLLAENAKKSKVSNLNRAVELLRQHGDNLGEFLTRDPKGKQLPLYLAQLAERLAAEQKTTMEETQNLTKSVDHIKDIVTMQQSYARVSGMAEPVEIGQLIEDAIRINAESLKRRNIQLTMERSPGLPKIIVDKHKVLQILINLIRNAEYACTDSGQPEKRLTIRVSNGGKRVRISLIDNGVGIPPENLTRIFSHGFSTRKDGHGFGLHSGAIAAKEMGGALMAHSEGEGKGATFTLELPIEPENSTLAIPA